MTHSERPDRAARWPSGVRRPEAMAIARELFPGQPERIAALGVAFDTAATTTVEYYREGFSPLGTFYRPFASVAADVVTTSVLGDILVARMSIHPGKVDVTKSVTQERGDMLRELGIEGEQTADTRRITLGEVVRAAIEGTLRIGYQPPQADAGSS
jgi:hypothetical protein